MTPISEINILKKFYILIYFYCSICSACGGKDQQSNQKANIQNSTSSKKQRHDSLKKGIDFGLDSGALVLNGHCADSVGKLMSQSNFLEIAGWKENKWKKEWKKVGCFSTELHDSGRVFIRAFFEHTGGTGTIGWFTIDSTKKQFGYLGPNEEIILVPCDTVLLRYIISHCIAWDRKN
jgi:hypothetical protein